jgi:TetR/AcrR family transcriptional regulator
MKYKYSKEAFTKLPAEKQAKILDMAINEFAQHGFESANVNDIASNAGISIGSMYNYFGSKTDLYLTVVQVGAETLKSALEEIVNQESDLFNRIEKIIRAIQSYSRQQECLTRLYNGMTAESHSELIWTVVSDIEGVTADLYASFIAEAQQSGEIRNDVDPRYFAFFLDNLFVLLQFSYACDYYKRRLKMFVSEDVLDHDELMIEQLMKFIKGAFFVQ